MTFYTRHSQWVADRIRQFNQEQRQNQKGHFYQQIETETLPDGSIFYKTVAHARTIAELGLQNTFLTPTISFWNTTYRRHTNFANEMIH